MWKALDLIHVNVFDKFAVNFLRTDVTSVTKGGTQKLPPKRKIVET
jgi:hypothetical protein